MILYFKEMNILVILHEFRSHFKSLFWLYAVSLYFVYTLCPSWVHIAHTKQRKRTIKEVHQDDKFAVYFYFSIDDVF